MDPERQAEIGIKLIRYFMHGFENIAKAIEVPVEELKQFVTPFIQEISDEFFSPPSSSRETRVEPGSPKE